MICGNTDPTEKSAVSAAKSTSTLATWDIKICNKAQTDCSQAGLVLY